MATLHTLTRDTISGPLQPGRKSFYNSDHKAVVPEYQQVGGNVYHECASSESERINLIKSQLNQLMLAAPQPPNLEVSLFAKELAVSRFVIHTAASVLSSFLFVYDML